jgi:hypothetical protein
LANTGALVREKFFKKDKGNDENYRESAAEQDTESVDSVNSSNSIPAKKKGGFFKNAFASKKLSPDARVVTLDSDHVPPLESGLTMEEKGKIFFGKQFRFKEYI